MPHSPHPSTTPTQTCIQNAELVLPNGETRSADLWLDHGTIAGVGSYDSQSDSHIVFNAGDCWVTPGLIDAHFNGALGVGFNTSDENEMRGLMSALPQYGVTAVLPTLITAPKVELIHQATAIEGLLNSLSSTSARMLGLHLEGPFINPEYRGAHPREYVLPLNKANLDDLLSPNTKRVTLAPEMMENYSLIHELAERGVVCAIGHTGADTLTTKQAIQAGARYATHVFNAMKAFHHRDPGASMTCLMHDDVTVEIIADGQHLSPMTIELVLRLKAFDKIVVTTDSNPLAGLKTDAKVEFGGQMIEMKDAQSLNAEGKLAGGNTFLTEQVRNLVKWKLCSFPQAIQFVTQNPARCLGVDDYIGQIKQNAVADLIVWDKRTLSIRQVFVAGQPVLTA